MKYIFADEAGCFTFNRSLNVSKYFILCTIMLNNLAVAEGLNDLRRKMVWEGKPVGDFFHATEDKQEIRDAVFSEIVKYDIKVQTTICEKAKAYPQIAKSKSKFYQYPWYYTLKHGISPYIREDDELYVTAASIGNKKEKVAFCHALNDAIRQTVIKGRYAVDFRPSSCEPCFQVADYCAWAIQRKWERGDVRSYNLINHMITREYDLWKDGTKYFY